MGKKPYSFRLEVPPHRWRLRLALVVPILLFGGLAVGSLADTAEPWRLRLLGAFFCGAPALGCLWWTWKWRMPTKGEATAADWAAAEALEKKTP